MPDADALRRIPSVASLLETDDVKSLLARHPRAVVVDAIRKRLAALRREAAAPGGAGTRNREDWTSALLARLSGDIAAAEELPLRPVINATGIVIHTNLGRAPLPEEAIRAVAATAGRYVNLEYDLAAGSRSSR